MASNTITLADLNAAIKPILAAIATLSANLDVKIHETYILTTCIDAKVDRLEHPNVEIEQPKVVKKKTKAVEKSVTPALMKRRAKSSNIKTADSDDEPTAAPDSEEEPEVETPPKLKVKAKSKAAPKAVAPKRVTVMSAFKDKYKEDPAYFDEYLTEDVKASLADEHDGLNSLTGDKLLALQLKVYYTFIKETYPDLLNELKASMM